MKTIIASLFVVLCAPLFSMSVHAQTGVEEYTDSMPTYEQSDAHAEYDVLGMEIFKRRAYEGMPCSYDEQCYKGADGLVCHYGSCTHRRNFRYCYTDQDCYRGYNNWRCYERICRPYGSR